MNRRMTVRRILLDHVGHSRCWLSHKIVYPDAGEPPSREESPLLRKRIRSKPMNLEVQRENNRSTLLRTAWNRNLGSIAGASVLPRAVIAVATARSFPLYLQQTIYLL